MGTPVVTVASGGLPVVELAAGKLGLPVTEATNGRGIAVTKVVGMPGLPVVFDTMGVAPPFDPITGLTGLLGWWDASVTASLNLTGNQVNSIADQSGAARTMNWTGFGKPTYSATGFNTTKPALRVDAVAVGSALAVTSFPMGTGNTLTFWYVGRNDTVNANTDGRILSYVGPGAANDFQDVRSWCFNIGKGFYGPNAMTITRNAIGADSVPATVTDLTNYRLIGTIDSSGVERLYVNGVATVMATKPGNWSSPGTLNIGRQALPTGNYMAANIAEIGVASGYSDATTVGQLDTYLKNKWGL